MSDEKRITVVIPEILYSRMQADVKKRQAGEPKFSTNDWVLEAAREKLEGRAEPEYQPFAPKATIYNKDTPVGPTAKLTAAELAAKFGVKTLATIEEVEPRLDPDSGFIPGGLVPDGVQEPVVGASDDETQKALWIQEFTRQAWDRAIRIPAFKKAKWPQRFEMAREQKERGE